MLYGPINTEVKNFHREHCVVPYREDGAQTADTRKSDGAGRPSTPTALLPFMVGCGGKKKKPKKL